VSAPVPLTPATWPSWLAVGLLLLLRWLPRPIRNSFATGLAKLAMRRDTPTNQAIDINLQACFPHFDSSIRQAITERYLSLHLQSFMLMPRNWWGSIAGYL